MKKLLLSLSVVLTATAVSAQVIVAGVSPASIVANYTHTWCDPAGGDWATPDFNVPNTFVEDTLMLVDDGSTGTNPQGNPVSAEGCNPLINDLTGKIAVCYRNTCQFGTKALNAQNAGAVGVIIINRDPEVIGMAGGNDGANVTIPVVMLDINDGTTLVNEMANGPVVVFMGNKTGVFANDIAMLGRSNLAPKVGNMHSLLAQNGSEYNFDLAAQIYNPGNANQTSVSLNATITDPSGTEVYNETVTGLSVNAGFDSVNVAPGTLPNFSLASYPTGEYTLTYTASIDGVADEYADDNVAVYPFSINDSVFSYAKPVNGTINSSAHYRPSTNNQTFSVCAVIDNANASRVQAEGVYFSATKAAGTNPLNDEEIALYLYKWEDAFVDLNDANAAFNTLTEVASGYYYYPADLQGEVVYGAFNSPAVLEDNQRFLACAQTVNLDLYLGFDNSTDYTLNTDYYLQPMHPIESDGSYFTVGFGSDLPTGLGVKLASAINGINENSSINGSAFPNPAVDNVTVSIDGEGMASLLVTDVAGKIALSNTIELNGGKANINIASLEAGVYVFNVTLENGKTAQFNVVKK